MDGEREKFEKEYASGDAVSDAISLARREDGEYEQALARMCFKWFRKGHEAKPYDFVSALKEAKAIVAAYPLHRKFIDGTPLQNDIAVMMAEFAASYRASLPAQPSDVVEEIGDLIAHETAKQSWEDTDFYAIASKVAALTTQQAQSGDVARLVEAAREVADSARMIFQYPQHKVPYFIDKLNVALTPFTQNKGD